MIMINNGNEKLVKTPTIPKKQVVSTSTEIIYIYTYILFHYNNFSTIKAAKRLFHKRRS